MAGSAGRCGSSVLVLFSPLALLIKMGKATERTIHEYWLGILVRESVSHEMGRGSHQWLRRRQRKIVVFGHLFGFALSGYFHARSGQPLVFSGSGKQGWIALSVVIGCVFGFILSGYIHARSGQPLVFIGSGKQGWIALSVVFGNVFGFTLSGYSIEKYVVNHWSPSAVCDKALMTKDQSPGWTESVPVLLDTKNEI
ncbi:hypothetical protein BT67DRAFT_258666 [Trichocladium antarcticum]|uniref:Uncharacterized protein n=1 Tax=Trichocladium antarcticum TaxID=1450529 RepID=A0AAN6UMX8_9PEZI|nr:hypothetical protein BT67DRAFT_258666 [Trichocladium antarcticum]